ncbi:hypothetical protein V8C42DRAFT_330337 [Trichoderma barbatum]
MYGVCWARLHGLRAIHHQLLSLSTVSSATKLNRCLYYAILPIFLPSFHRNICLVPVRSPEPRASPVRQDSEMPDLGLQQHSETV